MTSSSRVLLVSAEMAPFAKVGGLADVAGSLPKALNRLGHDVRAVIPAYPMILNHPNWTPQPLFEFTISIHDQWTETVTCYRVDSVPDLTVYLLKVGHWFENATESSRVYAVDPRAYIAFCKAVVGFIQRFAEQWTPQVVHCNDWHTALIPVYMRTSGSPLLDGIATVFTIHNLAYQGVFEREFFAETGLPEALFSIEGLEFYGKVNFMKGGLLFSDYVNTVSPTYAQEIQTPEFGEQLEGLLQRLHWEHRLVGILNGIDYDEWNPATDPHIPAPYTADNLEGKAVCKARLQEACGWKPDATKALIGLVSRLTDQKGLDLIKAIGAKILQLPVQFVVLGTGDPAYERYFRSLHKRHRAKVHATIGFDNALAHRIYAGADLFLMPSRFEPCGLGQMISLRYGTIPIVRQTGGLADTIVPFNRETQVGNGFAFRAYKPADLYTAVERAVEVFGDRAVWQTLVRRAMQEDWSWARSAEAYATLYRQAVEARSQVSFAAPAF